MSRRDRKSNGDRGGYPFSGTAEMVAFALPQAYHSECGVVQAEGAAMRRNVILAALVIGWMGLAGCQNQHPDYGSGPITLSPQVANAFQQYQEHYSPLVFAISTDGNMAGWTHCGSYTRSQCASLNAAPDAIAMCESRSRGIPCKIFAEWDSVVWKGAVTYGDAGTKVASRPSEPVASRASAGTTKILTRPLAVSWDGYGDLLAGTVTLNEGKGSGTLSVPLPDRSGDCTGSYKYDGNGGGTWAVACTNGMAASGELTMHGQGRGSSGSGVDAKGRAVKFTVGSSQ